MPALVNALAQVIAVASQVPAVLTTGAVTGTAIDMLGYEGVASMTQHCGAIAGGGTIDGRVETSDASGFGSGVSTVVSFTAGQGANALETKTIDLKLCKRYVRWAGTVAGTSIAVAALFTGIKKNR